MNDNNAEEAGVRDRLLDAAEKCFSDRGTRRTRMGDVAAVAGVHRTTVYLHFPNKDALVAASFVRAIDAVFDAADPCWRSNKPFVDQIVDASVAGLSAARESLALQLLTAHDQLNATYHATTISAAWNSRLAEVLGQRLSAAARRKEIRGDVDVDMMARWITRLCFSLIAEPAPAEDGGDEGVLRTFLLPALAPSAGSQ